MSVPLVSVLMPARDAARWIEGAVTSVLTQTLRDLELVVVDDGSSDRTADIVRAFTDPRVRLVQTRPIGVGPASNLGLRHCRGELVARLDADDLMLADRLERQARFLAEHPEVALVGGRAFVVQGGRWVKTSPLYDGRMLHWKLQSTGAILHPTLMARRAALPSYPEHTRYAHDWALMLEVAREARVAILDWPVLLYRRHAAAIGCAHKAAQDDASRAVFERHVLLPRGIDARTSTALAWVRPARGREVEDARELASLARRMSPDALTLGPHVPPWRPGERARAWRDHTRHVLALMRAPHLRRALLPVAAWAAARAARTTVAV